jgi:hypothetical protein
MSVFGDQRYWLVREPDGGHLQCVLHQTALGFEMRLTALPAEHVVRIRRVADRDVARAVAREWMAHILENGRSGYRIVEMRDHA